MNIGHKHLWQQIDQVLREFDGADVLLILPPFAGIDRPSLGLHTLQACCKDRGLKASVFYANIFFAQILGEREYEELCYAPTSDLLGERIFAPAAYGARNLATRQSSCARFRTALGSRGDLESSYIETLQKTACAFVNRLVASICQRKLKIIGCNTTFEQTSAAVAILQGLKAVTPDVVTLIGGANCEGEMARGISSLAPAIDFIFSGESEESFPTFLERLIQGDRPSEKVITGTPCQDLDAIPDLNYADYYRQLTSLPEDGFVRRSNSVWLPYETSRGCWWGQKHHCTFCGINGGGMKFREKSAARVLGQLPVMLAEHPTNRVLMVDNIMPLSYFDTLIPALTELQLDMHGFYEQKANLSLSRVLALKAAGIAIIQPGIESLSTELLKRMKKGVTATQNLALLRYSRAVGMSVNWNLLYAFPGDQESNYEKTIALLPLIRHLNPPSGACHLSIDRFSPYFDHPAEYGVTKIRPMEAYESIFPPTASLNSLAYHFVGDYDCATRRDPTIAPRMEKEIQSWRLGWEDDDNVRPALVVEELAPDMYMLCDTRSADSSRHTFSFIDRSQACAALAVQQVNALAPSLLRWALEDSRVAVELDGHVTPLATASPDLIAEFELESKSSRKVFEITLAPV